MTLTLADSTNKLIETVTYNDRYPWPPIADRFGSSLERLCFSSDAGNAGSEPVSQESSVDFVRFSLFSFHSRLDCVAGACRCRYACRIRWLAGRREPLLCLSAIRDVVERQLDRRSNFGDNGTYDDGAETVHGWHFSQLVSF